MSLFTSVATLGSTRRVKGADAEKVDEELLSLLVEHSICADAMSATAAAQCIASILNKLPKGESLQSHLDSIFKGYREKVDDASLSDPERLVHLRPLLWVTKAMVIRNLKANPLPEYILELIANENDAIAMAAAQGIALILKNSETVLVRNFFLDEVRLNLENES